MDKLVTQHNVPNHSAWLLYESITYPGTITFVYQHGYEQYKFVLAYVQDKWICAYMARGDKYFKVSRSPQSENNLKEILDQQKLFANNMQQNIFDELIRKIIALVKEQELPGNFKLESIYQPDRNKTSVLNEQLIISNNNNLPPICMPKELIFIGKKIILEAKKLLKESSANWLLYEGSQKGVIVLACIANKLNKSTDKKSNVISLRWVHINGKWEPFNDDVVNFNKQMNVNNMSEDEFADLYKTIMEFFQNKGCSGLFKLETIIRPEKVIPQFNRLIFTEQNAIEYAHSRIKEEKASLWFFYLCPEIKGAIVVEYYNKIKNTIDTSTWVCLKRKEKLWQRVQSSDGSYTDLTSIDKETMEQIYNVDPKRSQFVSFIESRMTNEEFAAFVDVLEEHFKKKGLAGEYNLAAILRPSEITVNANYANSLFFSRSGTSNENRDRSIVETVQLHAQNASNLPGNKMT
jgi:hypothetical protein